MECRAYCTAGSYKINSLYERLKSEGASIYRDVIHFPVTTTNIGDVFYFPYGVIVCWGLSVERCQTFLQFVKDFEENPLPQEEVESDEFTFTFGDIPKIIQDEIILPNRECLSRLAISHALSQSVKLGTFENALKRTFNGTKSIPEDLAKYGKISLSRKEIRRKMGELFIERNSINLHVDILDTPEFFWEYTELEPLYAMADNYLDIDSRVEVLNHRLNVVRELFEMLGNELNHQHSSRLEWTIICLIIIEVFFLFLRDVFRVI